MARAAHFHPSRLKASYRLTLLLCLALLVAGYARAQTGGVTYIFDELGRLVAVVDPAGEAAVYTYDAVGNLLSISRRSASLVSIIEFTPDGGTVGSTVTIYGTAFSATAGENVVAFNGVAAAVTSATSTKLVTSVPSGATTGPISVTTPAGTATSGTSFQVGNPSAPTIAGFSPLIGTVGSTLTINGTNFETALTNNKAKVNTTGLTVTSASATTVVGTVAQWTASGRVSVETPAGKAVAGDFFVAPAPYTAADVEVTGRMSVGESRVVAVGTANKLALIVFDGTAGQRVSLGLTGNTFGNCPVTLYNPNGTTLNSGTASGSGGFLDARTLPLTGTYTILVDPSSTYTGNVTLTLYNVEDVTGTITPGGAPVATQVNTPGQNVSLTFSGTAGQRVSLNITGITYGFVAYSNVNLYVRDPGGASLATTNLNTSGDSFIDTFTLPVTGSYTISVDPPSTRTGNATFSLSNVVDVTGTVTIGGPSVTKTTTVMGQNVLLTFEGTAGQKISMAASGMAPAGLGSVSILNPGGTTLGTGSYVDAKTLPATGTYTIFVNPSGSTTGSVTVTLYNVVDITGTITPGGGGVTANISTPGQRATYTFSGTAGQRVSLDIASGFSFVAYTNVYVYIRKPDGTSLASADINGGNRFIDTVTLPTAGTYTVECDPPSTRTGSATFTLYDVVDAAGTLSGGGASVPVTITTPGQNAALNFAGVTGQQVTVRLTGNTISTVAVKLLRPDGTVLTSKSSSAASFNLTTQTLAATGTYTVVLDPSGTSTGGISVSLTNP